MADCQHRQVHVRPASSDDADAIAAIHVRSWQHTYRGQVPEDYLASLSVARRIDAWCGILAGCEAPASGVLVLESDRAVVGFAHYCRSRDPGATPDTGEVTSIYLAPDSWGRGGGRLLMNAVMAALRAGGYREATLWVLDSNLRARAFYEAMRWRPDGESKAEDREYFVLSEVRYRCTLMP